MQHEPSAEAVLAERKTHRKIACVESLARDATTPLRRWGDSFELPVALFVLAVFAFLNAGLLVVAKLSIVVASAIAAVCGYCVQRFLTHDEAPRGA